ncbi:MAG: hypothetical protein ACREC5_01660 [Thermoplasmata archaeon]
MRSAREDQPAREAPLRRCLVPGRLRGDSRVLGALVFAVIGFLLLASAPTGANTASSEARVPASSHTGPVGGLGASLAHRLATVGPGPGRLSSGPSTPAGLAYDAASEAFFVADPPSSVDVVPGNFNKFPSVTATIPVGTNPFGVAYDNATGEIFVTNSGSDNVSVLYPNASTPPSSIGVGTSPLGVAYDPVNQYVYVAHNGSDNVSIISAGSLSVVATVAVGSQPLGLAADPTSGDVLVADRGSGNVTVISGSMNAVVANLAVESGPYGVAVDNVSGNVYVTDEGSSEVSVLSGGNLTVLTSISMPRLSVGVQLQGIAYDRGDGLLWVGGGRVPLVAISPVNESVRGAPTFDPSGVAYDPQTGIFA